MSTLPRLTSRYLNRIELFFRNDPKILGHRVSGHKTLDGAHSGTVNMFSFNRDESFRSPSIVKEGIGVFDGSMRGLTKALFDLNDYAGLSANIPDDSKIVYLRFEDNFGGAYLPKSEILVIPPASFFGMANPSMLLYGNAPAITALPGSPPPSTSMFIALPKPSKSVVIKNLDTTDNLMISLNEGSSMVPLSGGDTLSINDGATNKIILASGTADTVAFSISCSYIMERP